MKTLEQAARQAIVSLKIAETYAKYLMLNPEGFRKASTELREALEQPARQQEPVAWYEYNPSLDAWFLAYRKNPDKNVKTRPLIFGDVHSPQQRKPPTDQEIWDVVQHGVVGGIGFPSKAVAVAKAIEAAHGIKEQSC